MDFQLDSVQLELATSLRRYLEREVAPLVEAHEQRGQTVPAEIIRAMGEFGLIGGRLPESAGGFGLTAETYGTLIAEVARIWPSLRSTLSTTNIAANVISDGAQPDVKATYLAPILGGESLACFALSEPGIGSDARDVRTKATRTATGWSITGQKIWISNGMNADFGVVFARTTEDGRDGVSCFLFDGSAKGLERKSITKMGMHSCTLAELIFDGVEVPAQNLIGEVGNGFSLAKKWLNDGRCTVAFAALGIAQASLEAGIKFAQERIQFGKPIGSFQLVQGMVADMATLVETSRLLCYRAADALDRATDDCGRLCSMAKRHSTDAVLRVSELSMQVHGGAGYTTFFPVERHYRDARHLSIAEGTNQIQALIIGQSLLGLSALR